MRAYFASPYASYNGTKDQAVVAAMRAISAFAGPFHVAVHVNEVAKATGNVIWSPLLHGQFLLWQSGHNFSEEAALKWCLFCLEYRGFDTLVLSNTIPRKQGYGENGMDAERELAKRLGYDIMRETDVSRAAQCSPE